MRPLFEGAPAPSPPPSWSPTPRSPSSTSWREELAARVESFRRRRARLKEAFDPACAVGPEPGLNVEATGALEIEPEIDAGLSSGPEIDARLPEPPLLEKTGAGLKILSAAAVAAGELSIGPPAPEAAPVEILVQPSPALPEIVAAGAALPSLPVAPLSRRFLAGLADALILLCAAGLFALVFWRAGGTLSRQPLNFLVLGLITAFFIFIYFGLFTLLTASTPGLLWMGLEVRSFEGEYPATRESFWRAFGYLISIAGLMLGFIWTLVDGEKLSWHDRISNTFLTISPRRS